MTTPDPPGDITVVGVMSQYLYLGPTVQPYVPGTMTPDDNLTPVFPANF